MSRRRSGRSESSINGRKVRYRDLTTDGHRQRVWHGRSSFDHPGRPSRVTDGFTPAQQAAITAGDGPLGIIAGPGCGKTTALAAVSLTWFESAELIPRASWWS